MTTLDTSMTTYKNLLAGNKKWWKQKLRQDTDFFCLHSKSKLPAIFNISGKSVASV